MIIEPKINLQLTSEQASLVLLALTSGMIQIESTQKTLSAVFFDNTGEPTTKDILKKLNLVGNILQKQIQDYHMNNKK